MRLTLIALLTLVLATLVAVPTSAQVVLTGIGSTEMITFDSFLGDGFAPMPAAGQLDSDTWSITGMSDGDLAFGATNTSGDYARGSSNGSVTTGGIYAFDVLAVSPMEGGSSRALGFQPGGSDVTPGTFTLRVDNDSGDQIDEIDVTYNVYVFNDQPRANSVNFSFSLDGVTFTPVPALDFTSPEAADGLVLWSATARSTTLTMLAAGFQDGDSIFLRWTTDDVSGGGSRDEFALDDIEITATVVPVELTTFTID
ncbi:MAG: hypothetical protein AAF772_04035 [Acidobacteriota bacterium]